MDASCTKPWHHSCLLSARSHSLNAKLFPCNKVSKWVAQLSTAKVSNVPTSPGSSGFRAQDQESLQEWSASVVSAGAGVCNTIVPLGSTPTEMGPYCFYQSYVTLGKKI